MADPSDPSRPHYVGHRERLRKRFLENGAAALADYELLELLLAIAIPRRDVKPLAKDLIGRFGSLSGVLKAPPEDLMQVRGLGETSVTALKIVASAAMAMIKQDIAQQPILSTWPRLLDYVHATLAHEKREFFRVLFLNKKNALIADELQGSGTVDHAPVYPREIMKRALEHGATALILVHNHPSGDATPSKADIAVTRQIIDAGRLFNIIIHDHLIVAQGTVISLRNQGLM